VEVAVARLQLGQGSPRGKKTGPNPTDRGKLGTKRHILTDQRGTPLSAVITGANTHDMKAAFETLDGVVVKRPAPRRYHPQHLCLDKGYDYPEIEAGVIERRYVPHMRHRGEIENPVKRYKPKRWVVERSASWLNRFRKLLIRWEKKAENYLALVQLACSIAVYRRTILG
jgi:putative transposase